MASRGDRSGAPVASTVIRASGSRCRATRSADDSPRSCAASAPTGRPPETLRLGDPNARGRSAPITANGHNRRTARRAANGREKGAGRSGDGTARRADSGHPIAARETKGAARAVGEGVAPGRLCQSRGQGGPEVTAPASRVLEADRAADALVPAAALVLAGALVLVDAHTVDVPMADVLVADVLAADVLAGAIVLAVVGGPAAADALAADVPVGEGVPAVGDREAAGGLGAAGGIDDRARHSLPASPRPQ